MEELLERAEKLCEDMAELKKMIDELKAIDREDERILRKSRKRVAFSLNTAKKLRNRIKQGSYDHEKVKERIEEGEKYCRGMKKAVKGIEEHTKHIDNNRIISIKQVKKEIKALKVGEYYQLPEPCLRDSVEHKEERLWVYHQEGRLIYEYKHRQPVISIAIARLKGMR